MKRFDISKWEQKMEKKDPAPYGGGRGRGEGALSNNRPTWVWATLSIYIYVYTIQYTLYTFKIGNNELFNSSPKLWFDRNDLARNLFHTYKSFRGFSFPFSLSLSLSLSLVLSFFSPFLSAPFSLPQMSVLIKQRERERETAPVFNSTVVFD